ncbi:helix-turn-helix domain-containing protein [Novosphingobium sp. LASN5T]|uniref:helix-turn-helix domain-containing protein n=1 Tax=Novosphingobium sp. LASN5T TaxID=2491021 RepID=UPI000F5DFB2A|nr:helix-turn-helix domain-containing protein [Novosphingobium sp. LASN5T]RQW43880.1 helix-turn-helix domain-containing protein [Novosphingobium sp. LASN5T]
MARASGQACRTCVGATALPYLGCKRTGGGLMPIWLSVEEFAELSGVPVRTARYHVHQAVQGRSSRKFRLVFRHKYGRGGKSGQRYEVLLSSLPEQLQATFNAASKPSSLPMLPVPAAAAPYRPSMLEDPKYVQQALERYALIEPALQHPPRSSGRRKAIKEAAERERVNVRTIERWIAGFEKHGVSGVVRKVHANAGERRVHISRVFDNAYVAAGYDPALLPQLGDAFDLWCKSFWASRAADAGTPQVATTALWEFRKQCEAQGIILPDAAYKASDEHVNRWRGHEKVNTMRTDAKRFADELPRISRDSTALAPMEVVVIDVHHMNVPVTRPDGTMAWPKIVGFMDAGTSRFFAHIVLCEARTSIRREHVIEGFIAMATAPEWGFPQTLYLDNGSENGALDRILPALEMVNNRAGREIVKALPYNAPAKPIEPLFARLNRYCFSALEGYAGDDRMKKKTQNVGKEVIPYQGPWAQFLEDCHGLLAFFHQKEMGGQWGGRSPNQVFQDKVDAGWRPIMPDPLALDAAFCEREDRILSRGGLRIDGKVYTHYALLSLTKGTTVQVAIPWRKAEAPIAFLPDLGPVRLTEDYQYAMRDPAGAVASAQRKSTHRRAVREMAREVMPVDPVATLREIGAAAPKPQVPGRPHVLDHMWTAPSCKG